MNTPGLENLMARIAQIETVFPVGRIVALNDLTVSVGGLARVVGLGDRVVIRSRSGRRRI